MNTFTEFIIITSTALLMAAPLYASDKNKFDDVQRTQIKLTLDGISADNKEQIFILAGQQTNPGNLRLVCKEWEEIITKGTIANSQDANLKYSNIGPVWKDCMNAWWDTWGVVTSEDQKVFDTFFKGKLVYKCDPGSDKGKIELLFSKFANPFNGEFDLSGCGNAYPDLRITTNPSVFFSVENKVKFATINILIAPHYLVNKYISTTTKPFECIMKNWNKDIAPVGIFWRISCWVRKDFDYLTTKSMEWITSKKLNELHAATTKKVCGGMTGWIRLGTSKEFSCLLVLDQ